MNAKSKAEVRELVETFHSLRINKQDPETKELIKAPLDHSPYSYLHEGPDVASDEMMTFCPMCHQDMIMRKILEHIEADDE